MRKLLKAFLVAVVFSLSFISCTDDGSGNIVYKGQKKLAFSDDGGVQVIEFETPERWTASVAYTDASEGQDWVSIDRQSGEMGSNSIEVSVNRNDSESERTAALTVLCGDDVLAVAIVQSADGAGGSEPNITPDEGGSYRVKNITITDSDGFKEVYDFEYDGVRVNKITASAFEDGLEVGKPDVMSFKWESKTVQFENRSWSDDRLYMVYGEITLDDKNRAVAYWAKDNQNQYSEDVELLYDSDGTLSECREKGQSSPDEVFFWSGGNLTAVESYLATPSLPGGGGSTDYTEKEEFRYSEYKNNANIDLNWMFSSGYGVDLSVYGLLGLLGERSVNYVIPKGWDESDSGIMEHMPIPSDGEYTYTVTNIIDAEDEAVAEYVFDNDKLVMAKSSWPVYRVETTYKVYRTITDYDDYKIGPDGQKLYYAFEEKLLSKNDSPREKIDTDSMLFEIHY